MSEQIAIRIPTELARELDRLVASGGFASKADAIRLAVRRLVEAERRSRVGRDIAEGYRRVPQQDDEVEAARAAAIHSIEEEPW